MKFESIFSHDSLPELISIDLGKNAFIMINDALHKLSLKINSFEMQSLIRFKKCSQKLSYYLKSSCAPQTQTQTQTQSTDTDTDTDTEPNEDQGNCTY